MGDRDEKVEATEYLNSGAEPPVPKKRKVDDASDEEEPTPALPNDEKWIYIDATGNKQGPHATIVMHQWWTQGFFPPILPVKRESEAKFTPINARKEITEYKPSSQAPATEQPESSDEENDDAVNQNQVNQNQDTTNAAGSASSVPVAPASGASESEAQTAQITLTPEEQANYAAYYASYHQYGNPYAQYQYQQYPYQQVQAAEQSTTTTTTPHKATPEDENFVQTATFNSRTGKFSSVGSEQEHWSSKGLATDRAGRQMSLFFDADAYQEQMRQAKAEEEKRPQKLTKQMLDQFKKKKEEKKKRKLLQGM